MGEETSELVLSHTQPWHSGGSRAGSGTRMLPPSWCVTLAHRLISLCCVLVSTV